MEEMELKIKNLQNQINDLEYQLSKINENDNISIYSKLPKKKPYQKKYVDARKLKNQLNTIDFTNEKIYNNFSIKSENKKQVKQIKMEHQPHIVEI